MPKHNGKSSKNGKGRAKGPVTKKVKVLKPTKRIKFTVEQRWYACELKKSDIKPIEILRLFKEKYGVEPTSSTLATWYNADNMKKYEERATKNTSMASVETHMNPTQRPTILIDMEFALVSMLKKANNIGSVITKGSLKKMGRTIFNKLRALNIYDDPGERLRPLSELNEEHMNRLLADASKDSTVCPICNDQVRSGDGAFIQHIKDLHVPEHEQTIPSTPGNEFNFTVSDGWVRNILIRHNMHNVTTVGEMGSNDQEAAKSFVNTSCYM